MNSQNSRKIIVAGGMAVVVGVVIFAVHAHHDTLVAQAPLPPPTPFTTPAAVAQTPEAPGSVAQTPDASGAVAQTPEAPSSVRIAQAPDAPAALPPNESGGTKAPTP
jgi:hypothetical protein